MAATEFRLIVRSGMPVNGMIGGIGLVAQTIAAILFALNAVVGKWLAANLSGGSLC